MEVHLTNVVSVYKHPCLRSNHSYRGKHPGIDGPLLANGAYPVQDSWYEVLGVFEDAFIHVLKEHRYLW